MSERFLLSFNSWLPQCPSPWVPASFLILSWDEFSFHRLLRAFFYPVALGSTFLVAVGVLGVFSEQIWCCLVAAVTISSGQELSFPGQSAVCAARAVAVPGLWHARQAALAGHIAGPTLPMELCPCWPLVSLVLPTASARPPNCHFPSQMSHGHGIFGSGKTSGTTESSLWLITSLSARPSAVSGPFLSTVAVLLFAIPYSWLSSSLKIQWQIIQE